MGNGDDMSLLVNGDADTVLGTGNNTFYLRSADMRLQSNSSEDYVRGQANGAVTLYHNALNKLATTKYGVDVVGLMEADSAVISGDISIGGNLTVSGTTTTINTETLSLQDNKILLNSNSAATPTEDAGLEVERGNSNNVFLQWDEGADRWRFTNDGSTYYSIPISTEYNNYSLPAATSTVRGGIELYSDTQAGTAESVTTTSNRTYGIQVNSAGQAVVNVPWTDNDTVYSLPLSADGTRGGIQLGYTETGKNYPVELSSEKAYVNVPWTDTTYSAGTDLDLSGTTFNIESELNGVNSIKAPTNDSLTIASHAFLKLYSGHSSGTPTGSNTMQLYAANYQFSFGTDATNQFGIYEDTSLGGPKLTTTQFEDNLAIDAGGDIYLRPTGDNVLMQGITSGEQLNFTLSSSFQYMTASDTLILEAAGDIILKPTGDNVLMQGTTSSEQLNFDLSSSEQSITSSDGFKLEASGTMYLKATAGQIVVQSPTVSTASTPMSMTFRNNDTSPADNMDLGFVTFQGEDTASDIDNTYARIRAQAPNVTSSTKHGRILLEVQENTSGSSANAIIADFNGNGNTVINAGNGGNVQLGSSSRNTEVLGGLMVGQSGNAANDEIRCVGDITAFYSSDRTLKENIVEIDNAMDKITAIRGVYFDWTDEHIEKRGGEDGYWVQKHDVGVIAQEVEEVLPEVVRDRENGTKAVDYHKMVALLIEGMKEQQVQIDDLKEEIRLMKE